MEKAKSDPSFVEIAAFEKKALQSTEPDAGYFQWKGEEQIAAFGVIASTGWRIILSAPIYEFLGSITVMQKVLYSRYVAYNTPFFRVRKSKTSFVSRSY